ncbi:MAG: response regulator [Anaerolineae bacterium]
MREPQGSPIRVLIADDHPATRQGIRTILHSAPDMVIVGEAQNGAEAQQMVCSLRPDILLLDLLMPDTKPAEIEQWVREHYPETTVLILTAHDRAHHLAEAIEAGVAGYLIKDEAPDSLVAAVRRAARGEVLITGEQFARARCWSQEVGARWARLSERERQVVCLLAQALSNAEIAQALAITARTVEMHLDNVMKKLQVCSRLEVVVWMRDNLPEDLWKTTG